MRRSEAQLPELFREMVFPVRCPMCEEILPPGRWTVCPDCRRKLDPAQGQVCLACGRVLENDHTPFCRDCAGGGHAFAANRSLYYYNRTVKQALYRFKYSNKRRYAKCFAAEADRLWGGWLRMHHPECIIPIPMYDKKVRLRGYNQAEVFAEALSERLCVPYNTNILLRIHETPALKKLNPEKRRQNLKNAFHIEKSALQWNTVLLVDDIYTTGATLDAAAACLLKAGVREVYCLTIAIGKAIS